MAKLYDIRFLAELLQKMSVVHHRAGCIIWTLRQIVPLSLF